GVGWTRHVDVWASKSIGADAREEEQVAVNGQVGREVSAWAVDDRSQDDGRLPGACGVVRIGAGAPSDPDVERARSIRREVQTELVRRERGVLFAGGRVDDRAEVYRLGPLGVGEGHGLEVDPDRIGLRSAWDQACDQDKGRDCGEG